MALEDLIILNFIIIKNKNRDIRSYRQDSSRLIKLGFKPSYNVDSFKTFDVQYSDHYPIMTKLSVK